MPALMGRSHSGIPTGHRLTGIRQFLADRWGGILAPLHTVFIAVSVVLPLISWPVALLLVGQNSSSRAHVGPQLSFKQHFPQYFVLILKDGSRPWGEQGRGAEAAQAQAQAWDFAWLWRVRAAVCSSVKWRFLKEGSFFRGFED